MAPSVEHSLLRNGKVLTRRHRDGSDDGRLGVDLEPREMPIQDARRLEERAQCTLTRNWFQLRDDPLGPENVDFVDHDQVLLSYYPCCAEQVREASGADHVVAFDHNIRSAAGKQRKQRLKGGQQVQGPARVVHGDYTLISAPQRLRDLATPPSMNDTLRTFLSQGESLLEADRVAHTLESGRFAIINL